MLTVQGLFFAIPRKGSDTPGLIPETKDWVFWFPGIDGLYISASDFTPRFMAEMPEDTLVNSICEFEVPFAEVAHLYCLAMGHPARVGWCDDRPAMAVWRYTGHLTG
jgi:hypothetical protein